MLRILALVGLAGGLFTLGAPSAEAGCCGYSAGYVNYSDAGSGYYSGLNYGVRTTNPYAYDVVGRRAGAYYGNRGYGYRSYYGNRGFAYQPYYGYGDYGYRSYYGGGGFRSPYYRRDGMIIPPSGRGGYGSTFYRSGGFGNPYYGRGWSGWGRGYGYGYGPGISIGLGGW